MFQLNGKTLQKGKAFVTDDGAQFPANFLELATDEEKESLGIVELSDTPEQNYDPRFYMNDGTPRDLDNLKQVWCQEVKATAGRLLATTDWYIVRQAECSKAVPTEVLFDRALIRTYSGEKETAIAACEDVAAFAEYVDSSEFGRWEPLPDPKAAQGTPAETTTEE